MIKTALRTLFLSLATANGAAEAGDSVEHRVVPETGTLSISDYGYRDWGPEPVHYRIDSNLFDQGNVLVETMEGDSVPAQVYNGILTFIASVKRGETASYSVTKTKDRVESTLEVTRAEKYIQVRNEFIGVRLPKTGERIYARGVPARTVPGPLLSWATSDNVFMGHSRFLTERLIDSVDFRVLRDGPALFEYEARYRFLPQGEYVLSLQVAAGMPVAKISEEFDFGSVTDGQDLLMLDLHKGWMPETVSLIESDGEKPLPKITTMAFENYVAAASVKSGDDPPVGGIGRAPLPHIPESGAILLDKVVPGGKWGGYKGGIQVSTRAPNAEKRIALAPLHVGAWRRAMALNLWHTAGGGIGIGLPISVRRMRWSLDIADDYSPFSTHEHDPGLKPSYGRRVWGLYTGNALDSLQARFGYIGLDRYKNWVVDYPEGETRYPGVFFSPPHIQRLRTGIERHPDKSLLKKWYMFSGDPADAIRQAQYVIDRLSVEGNASFLISGLSHYRQSEHYAFVLLAEDALSSPELPHDMRAELRRRLALYANLLSEPDFNPRGSGVHLGNNNMTINRTLALTYFAALLQDHPRHSYWMTQIKRYTAFKFASQTSPDGAWIAAPNYQLYSPARTLIVTQNVLRNLGIHDFSRGGYLFSTLRYLAHLTVPDPRYRGRRIIPGMGNSSNRIESIWGLALSAIVDRYPEKAAFLHGIYRAAKGSDGIVTPGQLPWRVAHDVESYAPFYLPDIPPAEVSFGTEFFPAYGVVFRHHHGANETTMLLRAGMNWSHWDTDVFNTILYAKGAPLSPGTAYTYLNHPVTQNNGIYHNRVKVGRRDLQEIFGRVDGAVADYGFGANADYAVSQRFYPSQLFSQDKRAMYWRRHVLFVKSNRFDGANYFVMRDTFPGGEHRSKWWSWMNLGFADRILVNGKAFDTEGIPVNQILDEKNAQTQTGQALEMRTRFGAHSWFWFDRARQVRLAMTLKYRRGDWLEGTETKTKVEVHAGPGEDFFYLLYPKSNSEADPETKTLGDGIMQIATGESTDIVFINDRPFEFHDRDVVFTGTSGAIRLFKDKVVLAMTSGSGRIGYKDYILEGHAPFEQTLSLAALQPMVKTVEGGYAKKIQRLDLGEGVIVQGEGPFTAQRDGHRIQINTQGRKRVIFVSKPESMIRPQFYIDGQEWMASWTDYPASGWGSYDETWKIGLPVPAGQHELKLKDYEFPAGWKRPFTPKINGVQL